MCSTDGLVDLRLDQTDIPVAAALQPSLPPTNLYFIMINRIRQVKYGPFHEHSSQLYSIATNVPNWKKVNTGLFKMYEVSAHKSSVIIVVSFTKMYHAT
jgi:serine/threonine-protein phosphatase 2A activator